MRRGGGWTASVSLAVLLLLPALSVHGSGGWTVLQGSAPATAAGSPVVPTSSHPAASSTARDPIAESSRPPSTGSVGGGSHWYNATPGLPASSRWNGFQLVPSSPPAVDGAAMATDPNASRGSMSLLFGGDGPLGIPSNATWVFWANQSLGPAYWQDLTVAKDAPPAVAFASMDFDQFAGEFVLFGGEDRLGRETNQTWLFNPVSFTWTNDTAGACRLECPPARQAAVLGYDAGAHESLSVLFGGCTDGCQRPLNDTWYFVSVPPYGSHWTEVATALEPSPRFGSASGIASLGAVGQGFLLYGGSPSASSTTSWNDTWAFFDGNWTNLSARPTLSGAPPGLTGAEMTFDWATGTTLLVGGLSAGVGASDATWELSCRNSSCQWDPVGSAGSGPPAINAGISTDTWNSEPFLVGGTETPGGAPVNTTWVYQNLTTVAVQISTLRPETGQTIFLNATVQGGAQLPPWPDRAFSVWTYAAAGSGSTQLLGGWPTYSRLALGFPGRWYVNATGFDYFDVARTQAFELTVVQPEAWANVTAPSTDIGVLVNFTAAFRGPDAAEGFSCQWDFGDGITAAGANVSHAYTGAGAFAAEVTIRDSVGGSARAGADVVVHALPTAIASANRTVVDPGGAVNFTSVISDGTPPYTSTWDFGDGTPENSTRAPSHAFSQPGPHLVRLQVTDTVGVVANSTITVLVNPNLTVRAGVSASVVPLGVNVQFTAAGAGGTGAYVYAWVFGDRSGATGSPVTHAYASPGTYEAVLWVNDSDHASVRVLFTEHVQPPPPAVGVPPEVWAVLAVAGLIAVAFAASRIRALRRRSLDDDGTVGARSRSPGWGAG